ncbi:hypothetical protein SLEP1_g14881 [Rubroshorea leprosula]|uniref:Uncharacterized protein n=1 Tax=Rubroshorea leprosula TaxID=152421 RepID=A0AAV5IUG4_9ROSI|nr:hypothetical protein SLEP1_g14881 [Rubroshorea leprosula]
MFVGSGMTLCNHKFCWFYIANLLQLMMPWIYHREKDSSDLAEHPSTHTVESYLSWHLQPIQSQRAIQDISQLSLLLNAANQEFQHHHQLSS